MKAIQGFERFSKEFPKQDPSEGNVVQNAAMLEVNSIVEGNIQLRVDGYL